MKLSGLMNFFRAARVERIKALRVNRQPRARWGRSCHGNRIANNDDPSIDDRSGLGLLVLDESRGSRAAKLHATPNAKRPSSIVNQVEFLCDRDTEVRHLKTRLTAKHRVF